MGFIRRGVEGGIVGDEYISPYSEHNRDRNEREIDYRAWRETMIEKLALRPIV